MRDDIEQRLRDGLQRAELPTASEALRAYRRHLAEVPRPTARRHLRPWVVLLPAAILLIGTVGFIVGSHSDVSPPTRPVPSYGAVIDATPRVASPLASPTAVEGLQVKSVSELLAARAAGQAKGGPYALRGYWSIRSGSPSCGQPEGQPGELEMYCEDGRVGITELDEEIQHVDIFRQANETSFGKPIPPKGPHLTPYVPSIADRQRLSDDPLLTDQVWPPVPIVVVGHFDDPMAADCRPVARQVCLDRFVIDRIVEFDPASVPAPTPTPTPTPFPVEDPPPALFTDEWCYPGYAKSFAGWIPFNDLHIQVDGPGYVYAMVTRDVIPIGEWWDNPTYPGHKTRWWGRGVCYAIRATAIGNGFVNGTTFLEIDDGRHIAGPVGGSSSGS